MSGVLILGVASVQADALLMLKKMGYKTFACAMARDGPGADVADHFDIINILDTEAVIEHICRNNIDAVYSVGSDLAMPIVCRISEELSLPCFVSARVAATCNSKEKMRKTLGFSCKGNVPFQVVENKDTILKIPMPYIMKPVDSQGQRGIFLVKSVEDYESSFMDAKKHSRSGKVILEKYVDGPELSVNVYLIDGCLKFMVVSDRETWPQFIGLIHKHIVPSKVLDDNILELLEGIVVDSCARIGIKNGPVYFQIKVENSMPYIIEMTPRLDGCHMWKLLVHHAGINILRLTFAHLLNSDVSEIDKMCLCSAGHVLEFYCQKPGTIMDQDQYSVPEDALEHFFYYKTGDSIRPINGKYEKVGYVIKGVGR